MAWIANMRRAQHRLLDRQRQLHNAAPEKRIGALGKAAASITRYDRMKALAMIRADDPHGWALCK